MKTGKKKQCSPYQYHCNANEVQTVKSRPMNLILNSKFFVTNEIPLYENTLHEKKKNVNEQKEKDMKLSLFERALQ